MLSLLLSFFRGRELLLTLTVSFFLIWSSFSYSIPPSLQEAGISSRDWEKCEQFLINKGDSLLNTKRTFFSKGSTGLPFSIESVPSQNMFFIHLKGTKKGYIGKGCHKVVTKSILYKNGIATLTARCESDRSGLREAQVMRKLKGARGIVQIITEIKRSKRKVDIFLEYYPNGSLLQIEHGGLTLSENELFSVAYDLLTGLKSLHERGFLHRDLHRGNMLLDRSGSISRAALVDFGKTIPIDKYLGIPVSVPRSSCPPEALIVSSYRSIDRRLSEAYAIGVTLHVMLFKKKPEWSGVFEYPKLKEMSSSERRSRYKKIYYLYKEARTNSLKKLSKRPASSAFAMIAFKILHPDPKMRLSIPEALEEIKREANRLHIALPE